MNPFIQATIRLGLLALTCILAGCKTNDAANDGSLASVIITGCSAEAIQKTTIEIFDWNGFAHPDGLTFEKRGSQWDSVSYGGLDSQPVWIRIRVRLTPRGEGGYNLSCDAYAVQDHGERSMETENKLMFAKGGECKKILDQIKERLSQLAPKPASPATPGS